MSTDKRRRTRKLSPKQRVQQKFPGAVCYLDNLGRYQISHTRPLGSGPKERDAWADAASKL
jgi:hypothetical protein